MTKGTMMVSDSRSGLATLTDSFSLELGLKVPASEVDLLVLPRTFTPTKSKLNLSFDVQQTEAGSSNEWQPEVPANVASRFQWTAAGHSDKRLLEIPTNSYWMNGGPRFNKWRAKVQWTVAGRSDEYSPYITSCHSISTDSCKSQWV